MEQATHPATLLDVIGEDRWAVLRDQMEQRIFAPGEALITQGTLEPDFHVISEGLVSVIAAGPRGQRRELGTLGPGDPIGDMALLTGEPASADVVALTAVTTSALSQERLAAVDEVRQPLIEALAVLVARRLRQTNNRLLAQHTAGLHTIRCTPADLPALQRLPGAVARVIDGPVLAVFVGDELSGAAPLEAIGSRDVVAWTVGDAEVSALPLRIHRVSHDFERIVLFHGQDLPREIDAATSHAVVREREAPSAGDAPLIVITRQRWILPTLRRLSMDTRRQVVAAIPPEPAPPGPHDPVARLARLLTGRLVGLALGAGAAKGFAHIGVLRAFDEMGIDVDAIAGCSIGSAFAAGWAAGFTVDEMADVASRIAARAVRPTLPLHSFLSNKGIRDELERMGRGRHFEDLDIPLAICATDIFRRCEVTFTSGLVWPRILASMALPGIYPPLRVSDSYLVDGGVLNPVPSRQCRDLGAGVVIGVRLTGRHTSPREQLDFDPGRPLATETIMRCLEIMHNRLSEMSRGDAEVTLEVCLERGGLRDFDQAEAIERAGYDAAIAARGELVAALPYLKEIA